MQLKRHLMMLIGAGGVLILSAGIWLASAPTASAQCGSQASSCKNCHEVQGADPVNSDGTAWHQSHAFGDFCYICHAGNNQVTGKTEAHTGMIPPLSDIKGSCQQCHVDDLEDRAKVYATALGVELGSGSNGGETEAAPQGDAAPANPVNPAQTIAVASSTDLLVDDPNVTDYVLRYEKLALGKHDTNWGNVILIVLIGLMVFGGGGFVLHNEGWVQITTEPLEPIPEGYPAEIVAMLPGVQKLSEKGRRGLRALIEEPQAADELLDVIARYIHKGS